MKIGVHDDCERPDPRAVADSEALSGCDCRAKPDGDVAADVQDRAGSHSDMRHDGSRCQTEVIADAQLAVGSDRWFASQMRMSTHRGAHPKPAPHTSSVPRS